MTTHLDMPPNKCSESLSHHPKEFGFNVKDSSLCHSLSTFGCFLSYILFSYLRISDEGVQRQKTPSKWNETDLDVSYERKPHNTYDS